MLVTFLKYTVLLKIIIKIMTQLKYYNCIKCSVQTSGDRGFFSRV